MAFQVPHFALLLLAAPVALSLSASPFPKEPHQIPGKIEAEHYDSGKPGVAYHDIDEKNHGADYRGETQVDIEKRSDASNGYGIGWTRTGEWLNYTIEVATSGTYTVKIPVASNKKGGTFHFEIAGKKVSGAISIPDTGGWQILKEIKHHDVRLTQGRHVLRVVMDEQGPSGSIGDLDCFIFTLKAAANE